MKKILMLLLLCLVVKTLTAQEVTFEILIIDRDRIIEYEDGVPIFDDANINDIFSNYTVTYFAKANPLSNDETLRKVYKVTCDSIGLAQELCTYDSLLFPRYSIVPEAQPLGRHIPSDWVTPHNDTDLFNFIKAPEAWDISKGDSNTIIGVADFHANTFHPDMQGKYAMVRSNVQLPGGIHPNHGTYVNGLLAAKTGNGDTVGTNGMAYNCRLCHSTDKDGAAILDMAKDSIAVNSTTKVLPRVINASVYYRQEAAHYFAGYDFDQVRFDEIYERGTTVICGAGNGMQDGYSQHLYLYPASWDHNLSITSIGHLFTTGDTNIKYMHEPTVGDSVSHIHQHNPRVDLSAPGYNISSHISDIFNNKFYSFREHSGSSWATPLVTGTAALIISKHPWYTPYIIEYILKKSSVDIYPLTYGGIAHNQKYAGPTRWKGRLGAGALDAGAALQMTDVDNFLQDHPDVTTFRILGFKLNNRCVPGSHAGVDTPRVEVIMEGGKPPYRFKWERIGNPGSSPANIFPQYDSVGTTTKIIGKIGSKVGSTSAWIFHYRLTVYDNSDIEKVASKQLYFTLTDSSIWDLAMQDAYTDIYDEPNEMHLRNALDWNIWDSPDIWNRYNADGDTIHQNPDTSGFNHMHVRIKNIGCVPSPAGQDSAKVFLYWTLARTGEVWPDDWTGTSPQINGHNVGELINPGGTSIPSITPGGESILSAQWMAPKPQDFDTTGLLDTIHVCALARIETLGGPNNGIKFPEIDTTKVNVRNNNNLVTRNFVSLSIGVDSFAPPVTTPVVIGNPASGVPPKGSGNFTVQLITENQLQPYIAGHLASYMTVTIHMGSLYDIWDNGGKQGNPTDYNDDLKTIDWDMEQPLRLANIELDEAEHHLVILEFKPKIVSAPYPVVNQKVHLRLVSPETVEIDNGDGTTFEVTRDYVHSAVNYGINIAGGDDAGGKPGKPTSAETVMQEKESWFEVYPNPVNGLLTIRLSEHTASTYRLYVTDVSGKTVLEESKAVFNNGINKINTTGFVPGVYYIQLVDKSGKSAIRKFVKMD